MNIEVSVSEINSYACEEKALKDESLREFSVVLFLAFLAAFASVWSSIVLFFTVKSSRDIRSVTGY